MPLEVSPLLHPKYRPDIDGLRAIAVILVVAYHAFPDWIKGGFIGVDIFFVISGYLITTIILSNLDASRFSFFDFYIRRIKRIFPALIVVMLACYVFGWLVLFADEYKQLGKHIASGAGFVANIISWNESGYFDAAAEVKPLLHLWSLGVEEQFYLLWPFILWAFWKLKFNLLFIILITALTSFVLNILNIYTDAVGTFYLPQTRFWELLIGSMLAYAVLKRKFQLNEKHNIFSFIGLMLIVTATLEFTKQYAFPGWWALMPTLGAALIISAGSNAWLNKKILSNRILVWFGLISFPLYLWHWPILSFSRILHGETPSIGYRLIAVLSAIILAGITYKIIETPLRFGKYSYRKFITLIGLMLIIGLVGLNTYKRDGLPFRYVADSRNLSLGFDGGFSNFLINDCGVNEDEKKLFAVCVTDTRDKPKYALIGDSKAQAMYQGLFRTSTKSGRWLFIGGNGPYGAAVPVISENNLYKPNNKLALIAINSIAGNPSIETAVYVTATRVLFSLKNATDITDLPSSKNFSIAFSGLKNSIDILVKGGKKVVLVVDNPTLPHPQDCYDRITKINLLNPFLEKNTNTQCQLEIKKHLFLSEKYRKLLAELVRVYPNHVSIFDTTNQLCDSAKGTCTFYKNDRPLYSYTDHVSDYAAGLIGKDLNTYLNSH